MTRTMRSRTGGTGRLPAYQPHTVGVPSAASATCVLSPLVMKAAVAGGEPCDSPQHATAPVPARMAHVETYCAATTAHDPACATHWPHALYPYALMAPDADSVNVQWPPSCTVACGPAAGTLEMRPSPL